MRTVTYRCDVCESDYKREAMRIEINAHVRAVSGAVVYEGHEPTEWPIAETWPDLCPECSIKVLELLEERLEFTNE